MELEIGSPHKSLQSVGSLVWPSTVPRLRSLSTEQSQAKHIFIVCVYSRAWKGGERVYALIWLSLHMHKTKALEFTVGLSNARRAAIFSSQIGPRWMAFCWAEKFTQTSNWFVCRYDVWGDIMSTDCWWRSSPGLLMRRCEVSTSWHALGRDVC